ncbi:MAG TPA: DUF3300 domain-containing protein [Gemmatimonadaceae bacterium]
MRSHARVAVLLATALLLPAVSRAQDPDTLQQQAPSFTAEKLDSLLAPIALYPDPLLAQVLVAATFPDQIQEAAEFVRANGTDDIDEQGWDVSVKAVAHYPPVLNRMAERLEWTTELGRAYAAQSGDVMDSVQRLRQLAAAHGNLRSTPEQEVVVRSQYVTIQPAQPTVIYVPTYDPGIVFFQPIFLVKKHHARFFSFGIGFPIGVWLNYDCDWFGRRVFYHGWTGGGWRARSRPFIHINDTYVHPRFAAVPINRSVLYRPMPPTIRMQGTGSATVNRTVFYSGNTNGPTVYRSSGGSASNPSAGGTSGTTNGRTIFPRDLRGARPPTSSGTVARPSASQDSYRGVIRGAGTKSGPVIYRGRPSSTGGGNYRDQVRSGNGGSYRGQAQPSTGDSYRGVQKSAPKPSSGGRIIRPGMSGVGGSRSSGSAQGSRSSGVMGTISRPSTGSIRPMTRPPM